MSGTLGTASSSRNFTALTTRGHSVYPSAPGAIHSMLGRQAVRGHGGRWKGSKDEVCVYPCWFYTGNGETLKGFNKLFLKHFPPKQAGTMSKLPKFEIELPAAPKSTKPSLSERDIAMATMYVHVRENSIL